MRNNDETGAIQCACGILLLIFNFIAGGIATNYLLGIFFKAYIPFFWDGVIGLIGGEVIVPIAIVIFILKYFKVI